MKIRIGEFRITSNIFDAKISLQVSHIVNYPRDSQVFFSVGNYVNFSCDTSLASFLLSFISHFSIFLMLESFFCQMEPRITCLPIG